MHIERLMNKGIGTINAGDTVAQAILQMDKQDLAALLVELDRKMLGVVPRANLLKRTLSAGLNPMSTMVAQMTYLGLETCSSVDPVEDVAANMQSKNIRLLLVLDQKGQPIGTLSSSDLALSMMESKQDSNGYSHNDAHGDEFKLTPHVRIRSRNLKPKREYAAG